MRVGDEIDGAAGAAVAAVGSAARDELLAAEAQRAAAAVAGLDVDVDFVDEHVMRRNHEGREGESRRLRSSRGSRPKKPSCAS